MGDAGGWAGIGRRADFSRSQGHLSTDRRRDARGRDRGAAAWNLGSRIVRNASFSAAERPACALGRLGAQRDEGNDWRGGAAETGHQPRRGSHATRLGSQTGASV